jgi:hypothetical protein
MNGQIPVFTIRRVAEVINKDRKTVREHFERGADSPGATVIVNGQPARAWPVKDFPPCLRVRVTSLADEHCYGTDAAAVERFLSQGRRRWSPRTAIGKLAPSQIDLARKRCAALAPVLQERRGEPIAELVAAALPAWKAAGGYSVCENTIRRWIERAMDRDLGFGDWHRWEIYLDDHLIAVSASTDTAAAQTMETPRLEEMIAAVAKPTELTKKEREQIWAAAMNDASVLLDSGQGNDSVQRAILRVLALSGLAMAKNLNALRVTYRRKREAWVAGGGRASSVEDRRQVAARARKFTLPATDLLKLIELARRHGNALAPAYREAHRRELLTRETLARFPALPADKSFVPHTIREAVSPFLGPIAINGRGPRARRLNGAHVICDWSNIEPGDVFEFDDVTLPIYWWIEDPTSPTGYFFGAGQALFAVDSKSGYVLDWILIARPGYNARDIIQLVRGVHETYGLPNQYILFECGIWKRSRFISGEPSERNAGEICGGLQDVWPVRHTYSPTGKAIIERTFGLIQDRQEHVPGYTGRDMRKDCPEATKKAIAAVHAGRKHPREYFLHASQVMALLEDITETIHNERLGIRTVRIPGKTPKEVFDARDTTRMQRFGPESEHLFKTHRLERKITIDGIKLPDTLVPKAARPAVYRNEVTGQLLGRTVLAWVDTLALDSIFITDLDGKNPRLIERAVRPDARGADSESLARVMRQCADHLRFVDVLTRATKPKLTPADFRPMLVDGATQRLAAEMEKQKTAHTARQREQVSLSSEFDRLIRLNAISIPKPSDPEQLRDIIEALKTDTEHWRQVAKRSQENVNL